MKSFSSLLAIFIVFLGHHLCYAQCSISGNTITGATPKACAGTAFLINGSLPVISGGTLSSYVWQRSPDGLLWTAIGSLQNQDAGILTASTKFRRIVNASCGKADTSLVLNVDFIPAPAAGINTISGDTVNCNAAPLPTVNGTLVLGYTYKWQRSNDGVLWTDVGTAQNYLVADTLKGTVRFRRFIVNECGEFVSNILVIRGIAPFGDGNKLIGDSLRICVGSKFSIKAIAPPAIDSYTFKWQTSPDPSAPLWTDVPPAPVGYSMNSIDFPVQNLVGVYYVRRVILGKCVTSFSAPIRVNVFFELIENTLAVPKAEICKGEKNLPINGSVPGPSLALYTYEWQVSPDAEVWSAPLDPPRNTQSISIDAIIDTLYVRRIVVGECKRDTSNVVRLNYIPEIEKNIIRTDTLRETVCNGENGALFILKKLSGGDGNYGFLWQSLRVNESTWKNEAVTENFTPIALSDTTFYRRIVNTLCYADTSNLAVINVAPVFGKNLISVVPIKSESNLLLLTVCKGEPMDSLYGSLPIGKGVFKYQWQKSRTPFIDSTWRNLTEGNAPNYWLGTLNDTTYFRRIVDGGCKPDTGSLLIINVIQPISHNIAYFSLVPEDTAAGVLADTVRSISVCQGQPLPPIFGSLPQNGDGNYLYVWQQQDSLGRWRQVGIEKDLLSYDLLGDTVQFRRIAQSANCFSDTSALLRLQIIKPISGSFIQANQMICKFTRPELFTGNVPLGGDRNYTYQWQVSTDSTRTWVVIDSATGQNYQADSLDSERWFRRVAISSCFADTSNFVFVEVNPVLGGNKIEGTQSFCLNETADTLTGSEPNSGVRPFKYQWQSRLADTLEWKNIDLESKKPFYWPGKVVQNTSYRRIVQDACGFVDTSNVVHITVFPLPTIGVEKAAHTIRIGTSVQLAAFGAESYEWSNGGTLSDSTSATPTARPLETYKYTVRGTDANGCTNENYVLVVVIDDPITVAMNVITPNGDGYNDVLIIENIELYPKNKLTIYNRIGEKLGELQDYQNSFDGSINGKNLPHGEYLYTLSFEVSKQVKRGMFNILR
ncbi:MAG: gliding motility-associated C-terminal domain-containing protein [Cytophagales bacterium]|nr:MAG: gliding motility-associated C-terminal domain-containing protein [Cytophagales bacterium]TAF60740.1 MAG: gliding motility-associated C-terminal domain-containing protein [Cytophagales bacterium]